MTKRPLPSSFVLLFLLASCGPRASLPDLAILNVTVIDAVNGVREARTVVVDGGRITAVMAASETMDAVDTVDATGQYLIPGLWDFHVHLTYDERFTEAMPGLFLSHGITSIRDTGGPLWFRRSVPMGPPRPESSSPAHCWTESTLCTTGRTGLSSGSLTRMWRPPERM